MSDPFLSASELAAAIASGDLDPLDAVDTCLGRIDRLNPQLNAVIWRDDEGAREQARAAREAVARGDRLGPLHGVPIPIKDLTDVAGWPTTYGCRGARSRIATSTAHVAQALRDAGAILLCRTNTPEFGTVPVTENDAYGATRNPWNLEHTPGGSSGGASAAVASGMVPIAHANDGGGSIRIPASCTGLVGLKPSRGRVPMGPMVSDVMHGGAVEGTVSHSVADTALALDVIATFDPHAWYNAPAPERPYSQEIGRDPGRLRIAFTTRAPTGVPVAPQCIAAVERTAGLLEGLGHHVFEGAPDWPEPSDVLPSFMVVWNTGSAYWDVQDWSAIEPLNAALRSHAAAMDSLTYVRGLLHLQILSRQIVASWGRDFDVLLTPTIAVEPPRIGELWEGMDEDPGLPLQRAGDVCPFTPLFNVTGQPAISLPMHWSASSGLPIGVQLVGRPWGEGELLRVSAQLEEAAPWRDRRPPVW
ncbi:MAG TPA: amidase [Candidatus Binatia bacterium]|nr:amidase [Candidatus Binatia bacterium]